MTAIFTAAPCFVARYSSFVNAHRKFKDLNYIALTGALHSIGRKGAPPTPPLNLIGDFGGGSLYVAPGTLAGIIDARTSGKGQVNALQRTGVL